MRALNATSIGANMKLFRHSGNTHLMNSVRHFRINAIKSDVSIFLICVVVFYISGNCSFLNEMPLEIRRNSLSTYVLSRIPPHLLRASQCLGALARGPRKQVYFFSPVGGGSGRHPPQGGSGVPSPGGGGHRLLKKACSEASAFKGAELGSEAAK